MCQVARVEGHRHRLACRFMQACRRRVAFSHQQHRRPTRITAHVTHHVPQPRLAATLQKQLVRATVCRRCRRNALQVAKLASPITHGHQQPAVRSEAHTVRLHALARQVRAGAVLAGHGPQRCRLSGGSSMGSAHTSLFFRLASGAFTLTLGHQLGAGLGCGLVALGQREALFLRQVQQCADGHPAARLDALPSAFCGPCIKVIGDSTPLGEQLQPRAVGNSLLMAMPTRAQSSRARVAGMNCKAARISSGVMLVVIRG